MTFQNRLSHRGVAATGAALLIPVMLLGIEARGASFRGDRPTPGEVARTAVGVALHQLGKPYRWGGKGPSAFDASGLITFSYGRAGLRLPHGSFHQFRSLPMVARRTDVLPGDLVFANDGECGRVSSVSIVVADGEVARASSAAGRVVRAELQWRSVVGVARPSPAAVALRSAGGNTVPPPGGVRPTGCPPPEPTLSRPVPPETAEVFSVDEQTTSSPQLVEGIVP